MRSVPREPLTRPGPPPGIYASAYNVQASLMQQLVEARWGGRPWTTLHHTVVHVQYMWTVSKASQY